MNDARSSRLPLLEIIIVIAIFSVISVFVMKMYASAGGMQEDAENINRAIIAAERLAERVKTVSGVDDIYRMVGMEEGYFDGVVPADGEVREIDAQLSYDNKWDALSAEGENQIKVRLTVRYSAQGAYAEGSITAFHSDVQLCSLPVGKYIAGIER